MFLHYIDKAGAVWLITLRIKRSTYSYMYFWQKYTNFRRVLIPAHRVLKSLTTYTYVSIQEFWNSFSEFHKT
jgi:hypothetical protein